MSDSYKDSYSIIIKPKKGWQVIDWKELLEYTDLFYFLILRDVKALYKQTVLGFAWAIIRPVFSMIIFSVIFGNLAGLSSDGIPYPIFSYSALIPWTYFSTAMTNSTSSLISGMQFLTKVYFPRLIIPLTPVFAGLVDLLISYILIFFLICWYKIELTLNIFWIPLLVVLLVLTSAGIGMWLSAMAIQYRDIKHGIGFLSQLLMYAAPVVWPVSLISEKFGETVKLIYGLYPIVGVIEGFRAALIGHKPMPWDLITIGFISSFLLFIFGAIYFKKKEKIFADVA